MWNKENDVDVHVWPSQSLGANPIENVKAFTKISAQKKENQRV